MLRQVNNAALLMGRTQLIAGVVVCCAVVLLMLLPGMFGYVPIHDDLGAYHLPLRQFYQQCLVQSQDWTWCPALFGGYYAHGEGQLGGDHPLHQLIYHVLPMSAAFCVEVLIAYPLIFAGMCFFLRKLRVAWTISLF